MQQNMVQAPSGKPLPAQHTGHEDTGPGYYGRPAVKPSPYGWMVWSYIHVAGISGGAQIIATIASLLRRRQLQGMARNGRYLAAAGSATGAILLIADLHTPQRWYNMLRIFRQTSPMSIGTYILTPFGLASAIAAAAEFFRARTPGWLRTSASIAQIPAAVASAGMTCYTGALLTATSTPMWAATPRLLAARFASSAMASAAAALSLFARARGEQRNSATLDNIACLATLADTALSASASRRYREHGVATSLRQAGPDRNLHVLATGVAHALPLACYALSGVMPRHARKLSVLAALGVLGGGLLMRASIVNAGNTSASRPQDTFSYTQPDGGRLPHRQAKIGHAHERAHH
jgi:protein NrfD